MQVTLSVDSRRHAGANPQIQTAVILAAGRGIQLGPLGRAIPKGCIHVTPDRPTIVQESVARLRSRGINRIVIVTGHLRRYYEDLCAGPLSGFTEAVHNPRFATSGSMDALAAIARSYAIYYTVVPDLVWAEIDTPAHLERVRRQVYPALRLRDSDPVVG